MPLFAQPALLPAQKKTLPDQQFTEQQVLKLLYPKYDPYTRLTGERLSLSDPLSKCNQQIKQFDVREPGFMPGYLVALEISHCQTKPTGDYGEEVFSGYLSLLKQTGRGMKIVSRIPISVPDRSVFNNHDFIPDFAKDAITINRFSAQLDFNPFQINKLERAFGYRIEADFSSGRSVGDILEIKNLVLFRLTEKGLSPILNIPLETLISINHTYSDGGHVYTQEDDSVLMVGSKLQHGFYDWIVKTKINSSEIYIPDDRITQHNRMITTVYQWNGSRFEKKI